MRYGIFGEQLLNVKNVTKTKKNAGKWFLFTINHEIKIWVKTQTYLERKFEVSSLKNE